MIQKKEIGSIVRAGLLMLICGLFSACSSNILTRGSSSVYQQDLSKTRVRYAFNEEEVLVKNVSPEKKEEAAAVTAPGSAGEKTVSVNKELSEIIQAIHQQNKSVKYMPGFRIQLYVGNIRSEADAAKAFIYKSFPELYPYVTFSQPTYRVKAGDFMSKVEAEQVLSSIRLRYTSAMIISDKIEIEKGLLQARSDK